MDKLLEDTGKYYDMTRSVRPTVHNDDVLNTCYDTVVKEDPACNWSTTSLFDHRNIQAMIHAKDSRECFSKSFKEWGLPEQILFNILLQTRKEEFMELP